MKDERLSREEKNKLISDINYVGVWINDLFVRASEKLNNIKSLQSCAKLDAQYFDIQRPRETFVELYKYIRHTILEIESECEGCLILVDAFIENSIGDADEESE